MFLQEIENVLPSTEVKIKYDCDGGFERCGREYPLKLKYAKKNFEDNNGKHICRQCQLKNKNPMKRKDVQEKVKKTNIERYGSAVAMNTEENTAKRNEKMFGTEEAVKNIVEKRRKTSRERYNTDHPMQSKEIQERQAASLIELYGVPHPLQNPECVKKMQATNKERYGTKYVSALPEVRAKIAKTMFENYGVEHYNQLPEMKDYLRENCREWLKESWENPWAKGIVRPEEWNQKQRETVTLLIEKGEWLSGHKNTWRGHYRADKCKRPVSFFRSGFELIYHWHLDHDPNVDWYHYEPFFIEYIKPDGRKGRYFPDFLVKYLNDEKLYLREVKADYLHDSIDTKVKYEAAFNFVLGLPGMEFSILLKDDISSLSLDVLKLIESDRVSILHDPRS